MNENLADEIRKTIESIKDMKTQASGINNYLSILEGMMRADVQKKVDEAYQKGLNDGKEYGLDEADMREAVSYQKGLNDAWEAANKIVVDTDHGGLTLDALSEIFGTQVYTCIMQDNTAQEAIAKLKAYEEKQKAEDDIKLGDELEHTVSGYTSKAIFLEKIVDDEDWYKCLFWTGCGVAILSYPKSQFKRTGKHYGIDKILEAMKE